MKPIRFDDMDTRTQMQMLAVMIAVGTPEQRREAIDFLKLSTLQRRKDGMARSPEYQMAYRAGLRQAVRMLHKDAAEVKDEAARRVLHAAAHGIGVEIGKLRRGNQAQEESTT